MSDIKLTQSEAESLLKMLKRTLTEEIDFPERNKSIEFDVQGDTKQDVFTLKIFRGKIRYDKYNFGARIKKDGIVLLELHINPGSIHVNPDGEKIDGSHWHLYKDGYGRRFAYPAENIEADHFVENTILFFDEFNIIEKPNVNFQLELLS